MKIGVPKWHVKYAVIFLREWNPETRRYGQVRWFELKRPDQYGRRGGPVCAVCGGATRSVLDGEGWCDRCRTYQ
ncbi:MAG: hypothetical protein AB1374_05940 [Bacillota bacterium]